MSDQPEFEPLDPEGLLPFEDENPDRPPIRRGPGKPFLFLGDGLTAGEFIDYVKGYNFGKSPPDFVVLHHTAVPSTMHTRLPDGDVWDAGETGLSEAQIKAKRAKKLAGFRNYYRDTLGWDRGPHLYIDDRYIWLFTPMYNEGVHAMWGNQFRTPDGKLHYSVGIEVIGYYEKRAWPPEVAHLVGHAVAVLKRHLGTFDLRYLYPHGNPGRVAAGKDRKGRPIWKCARPKELAWGGIASHRDFNKPQCPGGAVNERFYMDVLNAGWDRLMNPGPAVSISTATTTPIPLAPKPAPGLYQLTVPIVRVREGPGANFPVALGGNAQIPKDTPLEIDSISDGEVVLDNPWWGHLKTQLGFIPMCVLQPQAVSEDTTVETEPAGEAPVPITPDSPILEEPRAALDQCQRYLVARRAKSGAGVYSEDDVRYIARLYFETAEPVGIDPLMAIAQMVVETGALTSDWSQPPHRNPAGVGVTGEAGAGLSFPNWTAAVHAHLGRLLAYVLPAGAETPAQQALIAEALQWRPLPASYRGIAPTLAGLTRRWAADPLYAEKIAAKAAEIAAFTHA